uniref:Zinc finger protein 599 n=1 Tax=Homo sapiens TaxID=9606 RepID=A0A669KB57_HUMAN
MAAPALCSESITLGAVFEEGLSRSCCCFRGSFQRKSGPTKSWERE